MKLTTLKIATGCYEVGNYRIQWSSTPRKWDILQETEIHEPHPDFLGAHIEWVYVCTFDTKAACLEYLGATRQ